MSPRAPLSLLLALVIGLAGLPGVNVASPALAARPPLAETLATTFPTLGNHLMTRADATPAARVINGQTVAGLSVTPGEAAAITAVEAVWNASTSAPWFISAMAASRSLPGSNQVFSQSTFTWACGSTERMPKVNALIPCSTSGMGKPAT